MDILRCKELEDSEIHNLISGFTCDRCGECCKMRVELTPEDITRIKAKVKSAFTVTDAGRHFLEMKGDRCIFYDDGCSIYDIRPEGCRSFPFFGNLVMECNALEIFKKK